MSHMIIVIDQMKNVLILVMGHDVNVKMVTNGVMVIEVHLTVQESERSIMYVCARGFDISTCHDFYIGF
jgi:hypothetical protein